jgi:hypothetical protein
LSIQQKLKSEIIFNIYLGKQNKHVVLSKRGEKAFSTIKIEPHRWGGKNDDWRQEAETLNSKVNNFIMKLAGR